MNFSGLKLRRIGGHLNLEIMGTAFNYTTGKLANNGSKSQWIGNDNTDGAFHQPRQVIQICTVSMLKSINWMCKPDGNKYLKRFKSKYSTCTELNLWTTYLKLIRFYWLFYRTPHNLKNPDAPNKSNGLNKVDSKPDTFIEFTSSDADLDIGQTAVPFVDTQPVTPKPPVALVGAGIFHKGRSYSGGYIAPKVFTYNPADNVQDVFPDINEADF